MKLYRTSLGDYHLRAKPPVDHFDRPVWAEVSIAATEGHNVKLYPVEYSEDTVTLSLIESRIFRATPQSAESLALWFTIRPLDRLLARYIPIAASFTNQGAADYCEFNFDGKENSIYMNCFTEEDEIARRNLAQSTIRSLLRSIRELP